MMSSVIRPTRITAQGTAPRVSVRANSTEQSASVRSVRPSVAPSAAVQHGVTSPSPAGCVATEDEGQRRVGGEERSESSDNAPAAPHLQHLKRT